MQKWSRLHSRIVAGTWSSSIDQVVHGPYFSTFERNACERSIVTPSMSPYNRSLSLLTSHLLPASDDELPLLSRELQHRRRRLPGGGDVSVFGVLSCALESVVYYMNFSSCVFANPPFYLHVDMHGLIVNHSR